MHFIHQRMALLMAPLMTLLIACGGASTSSDTAGDGTDATDALAETGPATSCSTVFTYTLTALGPC